LCSRSNEFLAIEKAQQLLSIHATSLPSGTAMTANTDRQPSNPRELAWEKGLAALKKFKAREKHCRVPRRHQEGAFNLGTWVVNQRNKRNMTSSARKRQLDAIGFVWDPNESAWEQGFTALKQFKAREKHCRVPRGHQEGAFNLGTWVVNQRNRRDALSVQRRRRLAAIGFVWRLSS